MNSAQLQVDDDLMCIDAFGSFPGRAHDARALRNCTLFEDATNNPDDFSQGTPIFFAYTILKPRNFDQRSNKV